MIEAPTTERTRTAMQAAHYARGEALKNIWRWIRKSPSSE